MPYICFAFQLDIFTDNDVQLWNKETLLNTSIACQFDKSTDNNVSY